MRISSLGLAATALLSLATASRAAEACGGCFVQPNENTVVTGHRMAMSISMTQSVLWDQIEYAGDPAEFSWVLPIKPGASIELANDAWFEVLDAATTTTIVAPRLSCQRSNGGFGCGRSSSDTKFSANAAGEYESPVDVLHQATVGPYETVTLSTKKPGALDKWLADHGYKVPDGIQPVLNAYVKEGFDFIALKLIPGKTVSAMRPVRVVSPGAGFALPLRMVGAGTGATTAIKLFVIGEGRYQTKNFANARVLPLDVVWNFDTSSSSYSTVRASTLARNDGKTFLTGYARRGSLLEPSNEQPSYSVNYGFSRPPSIGQRYFQQGAKTDPKAVPGSSSACEAAISKLTDSLDVVVRDCDEKGHCVAPPPGFLAASKLACGKLDDLAVAMVGMHPHDVWVTRLEAELPRAALATDLLLEAAAVQSELSNSIEPERYINNPCGFDNAGGSMFGKRKDDGPNGGVAALALALAALCWSARRWQPGWVRAR